MMNWIPKLIFILILARNNAQQNYSGNSEFDCNGPDSNDYTCTDQNRSCRAFLVFTSKFPYNTVAAIAALTSSDQAKIMTINNITRFAVFQENRRVIIPVNCSCSGKYYQASTRYQIPTDLETYYTIANNAFQGLSTCTSLRHENVDHSVSSLTPGDELEVPLRCACPTKEQAESGTRFLLTYTIREGDTLYRLSRRFNVSVAGISVANSLSTEHSTIYPSTTILIPLPKEPSVWHAANPGHNATVTATAPPPSPAPSFHKAKSKRVLLTVGIAVGALSLVIFILLVSVFVFCRSKQRNTKATDMPSSPKKLILEIARFDRTLKVFKFAEIKKATGNFTSKNRINCSVYRGTFRKEVLAVKRSRRFADNEVKMLHRINHFNIVKLHGFCEHEDDLYLVFEFMENGSLQKWLSERGRQEGWNERIRIALDVANALLYLHNFTTPAHVHSDIRSSNILSVSRLDRLLPRSMSSPLESYCWN